MKLETHFLNETAPGVRKSVNFFVYSLPRMKSFLFLLKRKPHSNELKVVNEVLSIYLQYAQETQHEKILRGLAVGIALTMFNRLEESDALVTSLSTDKDPVLRRSGMYTIAMAYCGTGNNQAIRKLLHVAVSISLRSELQLEYFNPLMLHAKKNSSVLYFIHT